MEQRDKINPGGGLTRENLPEAGHRRPGPEVHDVPDSLDIDTIVIMPVNAERSFVYWEITHGLLNTRLHGLNAGSARLMIRIFGRDSRKEILSFKVKENIGRRYIECHTSFQPLTAEIGILKDGEFVRLLKSVTFPAISPPAVETGDDIWMRGIKDMYEIVRAPGNETGKADEIFQCYQKAASHPENPPSSRLL